VNEKRKIQDKKIQLISSVNLRQNKQEKKRKIEEKVLLFTFTKKKRFFFY
jgi:hypothetical protein